MRVPENSGSGFTEGLIERKELIPGVYLAESLVTVRDGYALTGVLNTREEEVSIPISAVKVTRLEGARGHESRGTRGNRTGQI